MKYRNRLGFFLSVAFCLALILCSSPAVAQDDWESYFQPGTIALSAGVGFRWWGESSLNVIPGAEWILAEVRLGDAVPLSFGIAGRGLFSLYPGQEAFSVSVGALGTAHLGFRNVGEPFEFLRPIDLYIGLGLGTDLVRPDFFDDRDWSRLRLASIQGVNVFIGDNFALFAENNFMGSRRSFVFLGALWLY